eukprot:2891656-Ditylum_brightwellii.AAC.2
MSNGSERRFFLKMVNHKARGTVTPNLVRWRPTIGARPTRLGPDKIWIYLLQTDVRRQSSNKRQRIGAQLQATCPSPMPCQLSSKTTRRRWKRLSEA